MARRAAVREKPVTPSSASITYIETSALLAALLEHDVTARESMRGAARRVTSALTLAEARRTLVRARATARLTMEQERAAIHALRTFATRCDLVAVTDAILQRAGRPFPVEPIRTLDAIHLATADALGDSPQMTTILTRDARVRENARALGFDIA
jgi:uncharacterized protein